MASDPETQRALAAMKALIHFLKASKATTIMELRKDLDHVAQALVRAGEHALQVTSGTELFMRFITRTAVEIDAKDFDECKQQLAKRGEEYITQTTIARDRIFDLGDRFIRDGAVILTNSFSKVVNKLL